MIDFFTCYDPVFMICLSLRFKFYQAQSAGPLCHRRGHYTGEFMNDQLVVSRKSYIKAGVPLPDIKGCDVIAVEGRNLMRFMFAHILSHFLFPLPDRSHMIFVIFVA